MRDNGTSFDTVVWNTDRDLDAVAYPVDYGDSFAWDNPYKVPKYVQALYGRALPGLRLLHA